ncbi:MAG: DUF4012 domain-containing protein, partial [Patescibacteria group bacterium]
MRMPAPVNVSMNRRRQGGDPRFPRGVPAENVIDLKKLHHERLQQLAAAVQRRPTFWSRFSRQQAAPSTVRQERPEHRLVAEKVVVTSSIQPRTVLVPEVVLEEQPEAAPAAPPPTEYVDYRHFQLNIGWRRRLAGFAVVCLLIVLPVYVASFYHAAQEAKGRVLGISSQAYSLLQSAGSQAAAADFGVAGESFAKAAESFRVAQQQLDSFGGVVTAISKVAPGQAKSGQYLLAAGAELSQTGALMSQLVERVNGLQLDPMTGQGGSLVDFIGALEDQLIPIGQHLTAARAAMARVQPGDLPAEYRSGVEQVQRMLPTITDSFSRLGSVAQVMSAVAASDAPKRYLIVFQNNRELRPTGGFMGSIALMDISKGKIEKLEVPGGGIYDIAGQLKEKLIAPKPLWLVNPLWNIQDSNWFPDFPTSARKLEWFFERTGGATVDGVITLTPTVLEDLLRAVGPIEMPAYGVTVTDQNFVRQAQYWAEVTYDKEENQPKKFIADLLPALLDRTFSVKPDSFIQILAAFNRALSQQQMLLYFADPGSQQLVRSLGWDGSIKQTDRDYLSVIATNIGGGKTDHVVDQLVEHRASVQPDGSIVDTVTLTRTHTGNPLDRWEGVSNVSYVRFYVPQGSQLISAVNFTTIPAFRFTVPDADAVPDADLVATEGKAVI